MDEENKIGKEAADFKFPKVETESNPAEAGTGEGDTKNDEKKKAKDGDRGSDLASLYGRRSEIYDRLGRINQDEFGKDVKSSEKRLAELQAEIKRAQDYVGAYDNKNWLSKLVSSKPDAYDGYVAKIASDTERASRLEGRVKELQGQLNEIKSGKYQKEYDNLLEELREVEVQMNKLEADHNIPRNKSPRDRLV